MLLWHHFKVENTHRFTEILLCMKVDKLLKGAYFINNT